MFKPLALAIGTLAAPINANATSAQVSPDLYNRIASVIGEAGEHTTYLQIGGFGYGEIVRVDAASMGWLTIARGQDNTVPRYFAAATHVQYVFCAAAVEQMIAERMPEMPAIEAGQGIAVESDAPNHFRIASTVQIVSNNNSISVSGESPTFDLAVNPSAFGLCRTGISTGG